jgi:hypothetical protein
MWYKILPTVSLQFVKSLKKKNNVPQISESKKCVERFMGCVENSIYGLMQTWLM